MGRKDKKDKEELDKEELFLKNGRMLFERLIVSTGGKYKNPIRFFSAKELMKATNNYDQSQMLYPDLCSYLLYKVYLENQNVMVKKYNYPSAKSECMMDVVTTCQMIRHKNVVKLLGCCLETTVPTLVYDFASEGYLSYHLFGGPSGRSGLILSFEARLKIAAELASAITYLHTAFSRPIVLRDFKTNSILLDKNSVAKLHDFSFTIRIPVGETHVEVDSIVGTFGYMAPEYMRSGRYMEKIDVYAFGVFLHELLSGRRRVDSLAKIESYPLTEIESDDEILDPVLRGFRMDELKSDDEILDPVLRDVGMDELKSDDEILDPGVGIDELKSDDEILDPVLRGVGMDEFKSDDEILDPVLRGVGMDELKQQQLFMVLKLAAECEEHEEERRPTMIDVARELWRIRKLV